MPVATFRDVREQRAAQSVRRLILRVAVCWMVAISSRRVAAQSQGEPAAEHDAAWTFESGSAIALFPSSDLFVPYVADPHRPTNAILFPYYSQSQIPGVTNRRTRLSAGGRFGLVRFDSGGGNRRSWQVSFDGGLDALFDSANSDEAIGWDGNYGMTLTTASQGPWSLKAAWLHVSAHLGDEYEDHELRKRIDYTREELALGVGFRPAPRWRIYGEMGHAYSMLSPQQAPWRLQQGFEYESAPAILGGRFSWYGSADLQAMQERLWRIDRSFQAGVVAHPHGRSYRIAVEYYDGRPTIAEFFKYSETSLTWGLRIDL
jgi:hypothetical protein